MSIDDVTLNQRIPERKKMNYDHQRWIKFYKVKLLINIKIKKLI